MKITNRYRSLGLGLLLAASPGFAADLLVFLPGDGNKAAAQAEIQKSVSGLGVKVFTNVKDFEKEREANPSSPIIAPQPLIDMTGGYQSVLRGFRGGATSESYVLVTSKPDASMGNISDLKVGVWDIFGRKNVEGFVKNSFGFDLKKKKLVNKKEDLLPLLAMGMADVVVISKSDFEQLKRSTNLPLRVLSESKSQVGLVGVAVPKGGNAAQVKGLAGAKSSMKSFSFDGWR